MRILIAIDRSEYAEIVLEHGFDQATRKFATDVHVVTVVPTDGQVDLARAALTAQAIQVADDFGCARIPLTVHVVRGKPAYAIASLAQKLHADLLVVGKFHVPSEADVIVELVATPTLVVDLEGHVLEPQCAACGRVRRASEGRRLFCANHSGDYVPDLLSRVPHMSSRLW